jgi:D-cysteine desulfhydrase
MDLARFPRRKYTPYPTPIEPMPQLSKALSSSGGNANENSIEDETSGPGVQVWIKRDDLLGLSGGGNKTRKLEFVMADAIHNHQADTIITYGAVQSNHCRLTLSACIKEGLKCILIVEERVPGSYKVDASGNHYLFQLLGAERIEVVGMGDAPQKAEEMAHALRTEEGRSVYIIPGGASNEIGALGYCVCAAEIQVCVFVVFGYECVYSYTFGANHLVDSVGRGRMAIAINDNPHDEQGVDTLAIILLVACFS